MDFHKKGSWTGKISIWINTHHGRAILRINEGLFQLDYLIISPLKFGNGIYGNGNTALQEKNWNTQLMSLIIFYVLLATDSESDIHFAPSRLDFAAFEMTIFGKQ